MLARIRDSGESVQRFVERVKNKEDGVKLMGFGHRVYKNYDPRAKLVKESADEVLAALGVSDPLLDLAKELEEIALERRLLQGASPLPERRLLHRRDLQGDGLPDAHVHGAVRDRPPARAGSRTGARCSTTRRRRSAARSSCTWERRERDYPGARLSRSAQLRPESARVLRAVRRRTIRADRSFAACAVTLVARRWRREPSCGISISRRRSDGPLATGSRAREQVVRSC